MVDPSQKSRISDLVEGDDDAGEKMTYLFEEPVDFRWLVDHDDGQGPVIGDQGLAVHLSRRPETLVTFKDRDTGELRFSRSFQQLHFEAVVANVVVHGHEHDQPLGRPTSKARISRGPHQIASCSHRSARSTPRALVIPSHTARSPAKTLAAT